MRLNEYNVRSTVDEVGVVQTPYIWNGSKPSAL